jgi:hypothetical protein
MRIAYIAPYQGPGLVKRRPIVLNRSLAGTMKIELIATLLQSISHEVHIISQGEVVEARYRLYPSFEEQEPFHPDIPVVYSSALPIRRLNGLWASIFTLQEFKRRHKACPYDVVIIYNMKTAQVSCANYAIRRLGLPVILEYEDDVFVGVEGKPEKRVGALGRANVYRQLLKEVSGCIAASPYLLSRLPSKVPGLIFHGVVADDIVSTNANGIINKRNWVLFSGTHIKSKGIE